VGKRRQNVLNKIHHILDHEKICSKYDDESRICSPTESWKAKLSSYQYPNTNFAHNQYQTAEV
jgi:hypothetical protein